jgi:plastocyanin
MTMKKQYILISCLLVLLLTGFNHPSFGTTWQVTVANFSFSPSSLANVKVGDTVHFQWESGTHTTTSTTIPAGAATWNHPITSTNQTFDYIPTVTGTYNYKCTPHAGMGMVGSFNVTFPTGIPDQKSALSVEIFPNPVLSIATVKLTSDPSHMTGVTVFDMTGKTVLAKELGNLTQDHSITFDMSAAPAGIYFAVFRDTENGTIVRRIIKEQ